MIIAVKVMIIWNSISIKSYNNIHNISNFINLSRIWLTPEGCLNGWEGWLKGCIDGWDDGCLDGCDDGWDDGWDDGTALHIFETENVQMYQIRM
jgi:hypothetical protein